MDDRKINEVHQGRNIKRFREAKGIKQEVLAMDLSELFNSDQSRVARLEKKNLIDDNTLAIVANYLNLDVEFLKNLPEDPARVIIENNTFENNTFEDKSALCVGVEPINHTSYNNPLDTILQLNKEKEELYERLLQNEKEHSEQLAKLLEKQFEEKKD